jgi:IclR family mhp operon transcriptional activator
MERRETSRLQSRYFSHPSYLTRVGQPVNWLMTGVGRAYLAFCPSKERDAIIGLLRKSDQFEDQLARNPKRIERILAETRARGYGTRDPAFAGGVYRAHKDDGLAGIAVPLLDRTRVHGSINILWIRTAMTIEECAALYLHVLKAAAAEIVASLQSRARRR